MAKSSKPKKKKSAATEKTAGSGKNNSALSGKAGYSEYEHGQAWERGESIPLAKNES